jgi:EAL domain-containing protein (putative c-di-GMP-specific phosphodiesterase class I)
MSADRASGPEAARTRPRLLVIDDDQLMRKLLSRVLNGKGYETIVAQDGAHARELFSRDTFDLVLTDVHMPKVDGIAVLKQIRERDPDLPVILFTASPSAETAIGALQLRATAYLTKPIDPARLLEEVDKALKMHELARVRKQAHELVQGGPQDRGQSEASHQFDRALAGLFMLYQPIVRYSTRSAFGYEALVRSSEPSLPHPGALFDAAEKLERWDDLGRTIRTKSVEPLAESAPEQSLFLNLHARELLDETLYDRSSSLAANASRVVLEITERAHLDTVPDVESRIARLRAIGFRIAIDDIGAGYSGLNSFTMLRPDLVKLDMALVRDIDTDPVKRRLASLLVQLCDDLGIAVIGEGVETAKERQTLTDLGCDLLQGYLFGRPAAPFSTPSFEARDAPGEPA